MHMPRGFTLVEVVVSIFFVGIALIILQSIIRSGTLVRTSKDEGVALSIVSDEIEKLRMNGYALLPPSGSFSNSLVGTLPSATTTLMISAYNTETDQVTASVLWQEPSLVASSTVSLSTLITRTGGLP